MKGKLTFLAWFSGKKVALHINNVERHRLAKVFEVLPERSVNDSLEEFAALCSFQPDCFGSVEENLHNRVRY